VIREKLQLTCGFSRIKEAYSLDERISVLPISGVQEKARELIRPRARRH